MNNYYTTEETAKILKIKIRTLRQWINDGKIATFRMDAVDGRRLYISRDEILRVTGGRADV